MSEETKDPAIDAGIVAKVIWQAHKTLREQLGAQGIADWDKAKSEEREEMLASVESYLENKEAEGTEYSPLFKAIADALIPSEASEEKKPAAKKAAKKD